MNLRRSRRQGHLGLSLQRFRCSRKKIWLAVILLVPLGVVIDPSAHAAGFASECTPAPPPGEQPAIVVGTPACQRMPSGLLGAETAFAYYVPPACDPATGRRCPTIYLLHGGGGTYGRDFFKDSAGPMLPPFDGAFVPALTSGPAVDPRRVADPWNYSDPSGWVPLPPIDAILVSPHGRTLAGGFGPAPNIIGSWGDWNPRYADEGACELYGTPPPRFESHIVDELIPFVERHLPAGSGREWRSIDGISTGGFGAFFVGLKNPDQFASIGSMSGDGLPAAYMRPHPNVEGRPVTVAPPVDLPYVEAPCGSAAQLLQVLPSFPLSGDVEALTYFWGDPTTDEAYFRGQSAGDLAVNARAVAGGEQSVQIRAMLGDAIPRRPNDEPANIALEVAHQPVARGMMRSLDAEGVEYEYLFYPGTHAQIYRKPFVRERLADHYARMRHGDGSGSPPPRPTLFNFRTIDTDFEIWDWGFRVDREPIEFLELIDVTCTGLTLLGTGTVHVTVPKSCGTGMGGQRSFEVELGPSGPTDEHRTATGYVYGTRRVIELEPVPPLAATALTYEGETQAKGETVNAAARLVEVDGPPLVDAPVTFEIKGEKTTVLTNEDGLAQAILSVSDHGKSEEVVVTYPGDASHEPDHTSATVTWGRKK